MLSRQNSKQDTDTTAKVWIRQKSKEDSDYETWNYWSDDYGPKNWTRLFSTARGSKQSPIAISCQKCVFDRLLTMYSFQFNYVKENCTLMNDGFGWCIRYDEDCKSTIFDSNPTGIYKPYEIRCHWGTERENGSEHIVDDMGYAGELQFIHFNSKYKSFIEATDYKDGLVIFSVLLEENIENHHLIPIVNLIHKIEFKHRSTSLPEFDAESLLPKRRLNFWTYEGSLTMPPCKECVTWTIFQDATPVSQRQLYAFRNLFAVSFEDKHLTHQQIVSNVRPVQPLRGRMVRSSFRAGGFTSYSWD